MVSNKSSSSNYPDFGNGFQDLGKPYSLQLSDMQMHPLNDFLGYAHLLNVTGTLNIVNRLKTEDGTIFFSRTYGRVKVHSSFTVKYHFNVKLIFLPDTIMLVTVPVSTVGVGVFQLLLL